MWRKFSPSKGTSSDRRWDFSERRKYIFEITCRHSVNQCFVPWMKTLFGVLENRFQSFVHSKALSRVSPVRAARWPSTSGATTRSSIAAQRACESESIKTNQHNYEFPVHTHRLPEQAGGAVGKPKSTQLNTSIPHIFEKHTYHRPTFCQHCGKMLFGLYHQGYRCRNPNCGLDVHEGCHEVWTLFLLFK